MVRQVVLFILLWALLWAGLSTWRKWKVKSAFNWSKTLGLSGLAAVLTFILLAVFVQVF